eukprot:GGOE01056215.1.p4 GENE.GGOE01056215.1~~GGOE01056215.1.p4  ORF type:complete len:115 (-),score=12.18 GGOE01056215.1:691-1035(-)
MFARTYVLQLVRRIAPAACISHISTPLVRLLRSVVPIAVELIVFPSLPSLGFPDVRPALFPAGFCNVPEHICVPQWWMLPSVTALQTIRSAHNSPVFCILLVQLNGTQGNAALR